MDSASRNHLFQDCEVACNKNPHDQSNMTLSEACSSWMKMKQHLYTIKHD